MIYRLRYCNKDGVEARVDIQKGASTPIIEVEGTERPFILSYNNDKGNKSGMFLSSSADIEIYETPEFNIDNLKTSNETELSVKHYINNVVSWQGFIIPDFFSIEVRSNPVITMTASDRLGTLKNVTLDDLPTMVNIRELAVLCLNKTGLTLPLKTMADFSNGTGVNDFFNSKILTQRLSDTKGRSISCYDILSSILTASNSKLLQRGGEWVIINKVQHEAGSGKLFSSATSFINWSDVIFNFSDINVGGRRTIIPVAASTGVYHEHGGGRLHPDNYDFSKGLTGWSAVGDFTASIDNRQIVGFQTQGGQAGYFPIYGAATENSYLVNYNQYERNVNPKYLESAEITIPYNGNGAIEVEVDVNATGPLTYPGSSFAPATLRISVVAVSGTETLTLDHSGKFIPMPSTNPPIFSKDFGKALPVNGVYKADSIGMKVKGTLEVESLENYKLKVRIYGGTGGRTILVNMVSLSMKNTQETPKGTIFKIEQGSNYTKEHEIDTSIWGDYMTGGLNGYFYKYPIDDTSSLYNSNNELTSKWTAYNDTEQLPLLQHITRQKSRLFSVAHDLLSAEIEASNFDPLAIFVSCGKRYTVVSAQFDFFKSNLSVELEEVAFQNNVIREYIYSYFGDGESGIKSIGGISSGASGGTGIDPGLIGGINERIDDVDDKVNNIKVGPANLLLNTGFLGDFQSLTVDALTAVTGSTQINTNPLVHWVYSNTEVIDAPSRSGKGVKIGSIQQTVTLKQGSHVLSFWAKGNSLTVDLVESVPVSIDSEYKKYSFDITVANSGAYTFSLSGDASIYEIMLSEGNAEVSYAYAEEDDVKAISQLQAINTITSAIKEGNTQVLGGLILSTMLQLGKYRNGVMEKVTSGINGIYNNDNDPAIWAGGTMEMAIRTVQKFLENPNYQPTEEEWADMANIVFTHGGDGFFRGYVYALGGIFRGKVETSISGNRIVIDPEDKSLKMFNTAGKLVMAMEFNEHPMGFNAARINVFTYNNEGEVMYNAQIMSTGVSLVYTSQNEEVLIVNRATVSPVEISLLGYTTDGIDYNEQYKFEVKNNTIGDGSLRIRTTGLPTSSSGLMSGEWYVAGGAIKVK